MTVKAKEVLGGKFWIVEDNGVRVGTLCYNEDQKYMYTCGTGTSFFDNKKQLKKGLGNIIWGGVEATIKDERKEVHGFPSSVVPRNTMYDVKRKLPLFTKSEKSKSVYCAGYYIIQFEKGWVRSFCPKLDTCEKYTFKGPFKTEIEMRQELSNANKRTS